MNTIQTKKPIYAIIAGLGMATIVSGCTSDDIIAAVETRAKAKAFQSDNPVFAKTVSDTLAKQVSEEGEVETNGWKLVRSQTPVTRGTTKVALQYGDESVTVNALGKTATFTKDDEKVEDGWVSYENDQGWVDFNGNSAEDIASGNSSYTYMTPVKGGMAGDGPWDSYYAVVGLETPEAALQDKANATYSGNFSLDAYSVNDPHERFKEYGTVKLQADFAEGNINGSLTFNLDDADAVNIGLKEADISGNSFATTYSYNEGTDDASGDFEGRFYGNTAQEAGGTISLDYEGVNEAGVAVKEVGAGTWTAREDSAVAVR